MTDKDIVKAASHCSLTNGSCSSQCPLQERSTSKWGVSSCLAEFCKFIIDKSKQSEGNICDLQTLADNLIAAAKIVKQKTKRETPMQVCANNSNGKMLYSCPNCKARITVSSQTAYCDCCGQKLSFGGADDEL
jgi:hypothetical protein